MADRFRKRALELYRELYAEEGTPPAGYTLDEVRLRPGYSEVIPRDIDLSTTIGPVTLPTPIISAAMDTVSGPDLGKALSEIGGAAILYRHREAKTQSNWVKEVRAHPWCLVTDPLTLNPDDTVGHAEAILKTHGTSTIPVVDKKGTLKGMLFTRDVAFKWHEEEPVSRWYLPLSKLKTVKSGTSFAKVKDRLLNEQACSVLPVLGKGNVLEGLYFMKDFFAADPSVHKSAPLVGMAISPHKDDLARVRKGLALGVGLIVIDSSHGNCKAVVEQTKRVAKLAKGKAAIIAGNVADIDGYLRLADAGADAVKAGIGSGSICTTSTVTGVGVPMFSLVRELAHAKRALGAGAPAIIADGGIAGPGHAVLALAAGASAVMAGEWLAAASESHSAVTRGTSGGRILYRGMASEGAIVDRLAQHRYGDKVAPEGVSGYVNHRGPLKNWMGSDLETVRGGFAHVGAADMAALHTYGEEEDAFIRFTAAGMRQIDTRVELD